MSTYICLKSVTLCGVRYNAGDIIPADAVLPSRFRTLINQGFIMKNALPESSPSGGCDAGCECGCECCGGDGSDDDSATGDGKKKPDDGADSEDSKINPGDGGSDTEKGPGKADGGAGEGSEDKGQSNGPGEAPSGTTPGQQKIANTIAEETAQLMMQVLDSRKAINAALQAQEKEGES